VSTVRDVMKSEVVCVHTDTSLAGLEEILLRHRIGGAPVLDGERVVGVVSRSDVVRQLQLERSWVEAISSFYLDPFDSEQRDFEDGARITEVLAHRLRDLTVGDVMQTELLITSPDAELASVAQQMLERRVHRILVMEGESLQGIVSSLDLVRLFAEGKATLRTRRG
jgi:CBS domain-containing protein